MKALLYKDFTVTKKLMLLLLLVILGIYVSFFLFATEDTIMSFFLVATLAFSYIYIMYTLNIDENNRFPSFAFSSPISRKSYVLSKYIPFLVFGLLGGVVCFVTNTITNKPFHSFAYHAGYFTVYDWIGRNILVTIAYNNLLAAFLLPLIFQLGVKKGQIVFFIFIIICWLLIIRGWIWMPYFLPQSLYMPLLFFLPLGLSIPLSFFIVNKKEY